jgi:hypothetical protein
LYRIIVQGFLKRAQELGEVFPDVLSLDPRSAQIPYRGQSSSGLSIRDAPLSPWTSDIYFKYFRLITTHVL